MTHDELLDSVQEAYGADRSYELFKALRAVVKLHKPVLDTFLYGLELDPPEVTQNYECIMCGTGIKYPCHTIQAIEKELG